MEVIKIGSQQDLWKKFFFLFSFSNLIHYSYFLWQLLTSFNYYHFLFFFLIDKKFIVIILYTWKKNKNFEHSSSSSHLQLLLLWNGQSFFCEEETDSEQCLKSSLEKDVYFFVEDDILYVCDKFDFGTFLYLLALQILSGSAYFTFCFLTLTTFFFFFFKYFFIINQKKKSTFFFYFMFYILCLISFVPHFSFSVLNHSVFFTTLKINKYLNWIIF